MNLRLYYHRLYSESNDAGVGKLWSAPKPARLGGGAGAGWKPALLWVN